tara:strand:+ start:413 stop:655 length:243 start_codon:yes stop_codon:yes gene_type:complete
MIKKSMWLSGEEASKVLRVNEQFLEVLRERGCLRPGFHWRSSNDPKQLPWNPKVLYSIIGCKDTIDYWKDKHASFDQIAA